MDCPLRVTCFQCPLPSPRPLMLLPTPDPGLPPLDDQAWLLGSTRTGYTFERERMPFNYRVPARLPHPGPERLLLDVLFTVRGRAKVQLEIRTETHG